MSIIIFVSLARRASKAAPPRKHEITKKRNHRETPTHRDMKIAGAMRQSLLCDSVTLCGLFSTVSRGIAIVV